MRVFSAITLPQALKEEISLIIKDLSSDYINYKWVSKENLHLTLQFYGEKSLEEVNLIKSILAKASNNFAACEVYITSLEGFPSLKKPRVVFLKIEGNKGLDTIKNLQKYLSIELKKQGMVVEEKEFIPHLTLGRAKGHPQPFSLPNLLVKEFRLEVLSIVLFESVLKPSGPVYTIIGEYPLKK